MKKLLVIGSVNMDIVSGVKQFPLPGETIDSISLSYFPGGKGANQAVAAARSGANCYMIGAVGNDGFADKLTHELARSGVRVDHVLRKQGASGIAIITVNEEGENNIVIAKGSNSKLTSADIDEHVHWEAVYAVLLQNEISWDTTKYVIEQAKTASVAVWLNPAPAVSIPQTLWSSIDTFIMNETETAVITGIQVDNEQSALQAAMLLIAKGVKRVIITLGEHGCVYADVQGEQYSIPAIKVKAVDTTAAGDTFIGAFAAASFAGEGTKQALVYAVAASALAVTKAGAQSSIPTREEVISFIGMNKLV
ncbi:ribokinase [Paenibacillus endoradicis]|uniref:ribokinase n=1 Tax=Paenibacillus endoradicis TaxID=2972487 RepID=UPI0021592D95|nr:ribokinase [Paenibacillus endoradicis]MCR8657584.1 ribokinase [Paenibacillus endoradicis]